MLARIAQELFWLGRDVTRAENTARMLDGAFHADVADVAGTRGLALSWDGVLAIIGAKPPAPGEPGDSLVRLSAEQRSGPPASTATRRAEVTGLLTLDTENPASIVSCVARARERGRTLRDVISTEMWEALNSFYLSLGSHLHGALISGPYSVYQEIKERCALFWGLVDRTMLRDEGRSFLEAGRYIEEADMVLRMLRVAIPGEPREGGHEGDALALLHAVGGLQAYARAIRQTPTLGPVVCFVLYDSAYPSSVASSVQALRDALATADPQPRTSPPVLRLERLLADLELQRRTSGEAGALDEGLARVQNELELVDRDIDNRYFEIAALAALHL